VTSFVKIAQQIQLLLKKHVSALFNVFVSAKIEFSNSVMKSDAVTRNNRVTITKLQSLSC
jgi:hypothetical protein